MNFVSSYPPHVLSPGIHLEYTPTMDRLHASALSCNCRYPIDDAFLSLQWIYANEKLRARVQHQLKDFRKMCLATRATEETLIRQ